MVLEPAPVRMKISEISGPNAINFYPKHHCVRGKAAIGFASDRIRILVSMATDSPHRVIMGENVVNTLATSFLIGSSSFLQVTWTTIKSQMSLKFDQIRPLTAELAAL